MPNNSSNNNNNVLSIVYFSRKSKELYYTSGMMNIQKLHNIDQICQIFQGEKVGKNPK